MGAAALGQILDQDEIVQQERESLKRLQAEWEEKLRQAEIDISVERAKLARQRAEVEERLRSLEEKGGATQSEPSDSAEPQKPARGRWLSRLGLKDSDDA